LEDRDLEFAKVDVPEGALLNLISRLGSLEWRRYVNRSSSINKNGIWKQVDYIERPPAISFRFKNENINTINFLKDSVESYNGLIKWTMTEHKRINLPGRNWVIWPQKSAEVHDQALKMNMSVGEYFAKFRPELGSIAYEDMKGLYAHLERLLASR
jgi:hypothetical protein